MAQARQLTKEGFERLKGELEQLRTVSRRENSEALKEAKSHGDLKENAAYHEVKLNRDRLELRIQELEKLLMTAKIIERPKTEDGEAHLGSKLTLLDVDHGDELEIKLVGPYEADPSHDLVSIASPLGEALLGKREGDEIVIDAPEGESRYRVKAVD